MSDKPLPRNDRILELKEIAKERKFLVAISSETFQSVSWQVRSYQESVRVDNPVAKYIANYHFLEKKP